jgi:hypothetical protein
MTVASYLRHSELTEVAMARSERIEFAGALGDSSPPGWSIRTARRLGYALFAHCFSCSKDIHAAQRISRRLTEHGFAVLRFDFTGLGHSRRRFRQHQFQLQRR